MNNSAPKGRRYNIPQNSSTRSSTDFVRILLDIIMMQAGRQAGRQVFFLVDIYVLV
jgi:hypothetical protein